MQINGAIRGGGVLQSFTKFHKMSQNFNPMHNVSQRFTTFHNFSQLFTTFHNFSQLFTTTVKIFILGCNYSETEVYWTGTKLEHLGFLGVSQFCSGPEQFCWGRIFIPIPTPPRCIVHLWAKKNSSHSSFFLTRHGYPPKTMLVRNKTGTIDDFLGCSSFVPAQNKYFYGMYTHRCEKL